MSSSEQSPSQPRLLAIVPAHNEAGSIGRAIADLRRFVPWADIAVVDDGSADETGAIAASAGATVLRLPCNLGVGGAVQTGYKFAFAGRYDLAVQFDGDAQHRANQIPALIAPILARQADLVVGSRLVGGRRRYRFQTSRFVGSRFLAALISILIGRRITDPTSGFRAAGAATIELFASNYPQTYLADTAEALVWAGRAGLRITEVPVRMRQRRAGLSATGLLRGVSHVLRITLAILIDRLEQPISRQQGTPHE